MHISRGCGGRFLASLSKARVSLLHPESGRICIWVQISKDLLPINRQLREYREAWDRFVDAWLVVKVKDPNYVFKWRQQAEWYPLL